MNEDYPRALSQGSFDKIGLVLKLSVTLDYDDLRPVHLKPYRRSMRLRTASDLDKQKNDLPYSPLSLRRRRAVKLHRQSVSEFAGELGLTETQLYRFLDGTISLSQAKGDALCDILGLYMRDSPVFITPGVWCEMLRTERRIYRSGPAAPAPGQVHPE